LKDNLTIKTSTGPDEMEQVGKKVGNALRGKDNTDELSFKGGTRVAKNAVGGPVTLKDVPLHVGQNDPFKGVGNEEFFNIGVHNFN
jgi:hypothetical protein